MLIGSLVSPERTVHISSTLIPNKLIMVMAIMMNPRLMQNDGSLMQQGYLLRGLHGPATGMDSCGFHSPRQHGVLERSGGFHVESNSPTASSAPDFLKLYEKELGMRG